MNNFGYLRSRMASGKSFIWKLFTTDYGIDLNSNRAGKVSINANRTKMASENFTVSSSGFALVNPVETNVRSLAGKYIVDITTSNSTSTNGSTIYYVVQSENTISYVAFSYGQTSRGSYTGDKVQSGKLEYPVHDVLDDIYYYLISGQYKQYKWIQKLPSTVIQYEDHAFSWATEIPVTGSDFNTYVYAGTGYELTANGRLALIDARNSYIYSIFDSNLFWQYSGVSDADNTFTSLYHGLKHYDNDIQRYYADETIYVRSQNVEVAGMATGFVKHSLNADAYPQNGKHTDGFWYVSDGFEIITAHDN